MKERPIIFNGAMVRAILDGRKTQTRRVARPQGCDGVHSDGPATCVPVLLETGEWGWDFSTGGEIHGPMVRCPYGAPGDRLWVKHPYDVFDQYLRDIPGWPEYAAGTDGHIYRVDRGEPRRLRATPTSQGYPSVSLSRGTKVTRSVHTLIAESFYGPAPTPDHQVRHMNGDRSDSRPQNLDWGTQEDNWRDRKAHGRGMGESHHCAKLTSKQVGDIRGSGRTQRQLAAQYGVSQSTVQAIKAGNGWADHAPAPRNIKAWRPWRSARFQPRWASRLTLEVIDVRVERVQDIDHCDIRSEGVACPDHDFVGGFCTSECGPLRRAWARLWDSINAKRGFGWDTNPWVWVVTFRDVSREAS